VLAGSTIRRPRGLNGPAIAPSLKSGSLVAAFGTRAAIGLSVIPGVAAAAIIYAIRDTRTPRERARPPIRLQIRPVLGPVRVRGFFAGIARLRTR
jgi:hypothetical protein